MNTITANQLQIQGIALLEAGLNEQLEVVITVHDQQRFVVVDTERYQYLRECELAAAWWQAQADRVAGRYVTESVEEHLKRIVSAGDDYGV